MLRSQLTVPRLLLLTTLSLLTACPGWFDGPDDGPGGIDMGGELDHDPSCNLDGELTVEIGDGTDGFGELAEDGGGLIVHHGPQGGTHIWLGARIGNLALDRYDEVGVSLGVYDPLQCEPVGSPCQGAPLWFQGDWVLGDVTPLDPIDEHTIEQDRMTAVFDLHDQPLVFELRAEDPCGQRGSAQLR